MTPARRHFAIGLFTLVGLLLLASACVLFGGADLFAKKAYFETYFESSVQGLDVGSAVKFRGVRIGTVEAIGFAGATYGDRAKLDPDDQAAFRPLSYVRVLCSVDLDQHPDFDAARLAAMVGRGLHAKLDLQGITGQILVNLDFPRNGAAVAPALDVPWRPDTLYVPSTPTSLQNLLNIAQDIASKLGNSDFPKAVDALTTLAQNVDKIAADADVPKLTASFTQLGDTLNKQTQQISAIIERLGPQRLSADLAETLSALARTTAAAEALVQELRQKPSRLLFDQPLED